MEYYAVTKTNNPSDELTHWKYISREKVNGKWKYIYDDSTSETNVLKKKTEEAQKNFDDHFEEKVDSSIAKVEKWIHKNVLNTKAGDIAADVIGRGKERVRSLLEKPVKKRKTITNEKQFDMSNVTKVKNPYKKRKTITNEKQFDMSNVTKVKNPYNRQS